MRNKGFTLIELVAVIVILGMLSLTALPRFINLQSDARISVLKGLAGSIKAVNNQVYAMSFMDFVVTRNGGGSSSRLKFLDLNKDGIQQESDGEWDLIWNYLDNTHISDAVVFDSRLVDEEEGAPNYYIGFDMDGTGTPKSGMCYVLYVQAASATDEPDYIIETSGC